MHFDLILLVYSFQYSARHQLFSFMGNARTFLRPLSAFDETAPQQES